MIRALDPVFDLPAVVQFYTDAPDYWELAEGRAPGAAKAAAFFTDGPPDCDPDLSYRLGLFVDDRLSGLAELSFGFPAPGDAYLGFMMLGPWARGHGHGQTFLDHLRKLAKGRGCDRLFLAVMASNPRGRAFWQRMGFADTGRQATMQVGDKEQTLHRMVNAL